MNLLGREFTFSLGIHDQIIELPIRIQNLLLGSKQLGGTMFVRVAIFVRVAN